MKRTMLTLSLVGAIASGVVLFGSPQKAEAHGKSSVGVFVGGGGFGVSVGYRTPYHYRPAYVGYYSAPVVAPSCCQYQRVLTPGYYDSLGYWHPGYYRTYRSCAYHGAVWMP